MGHQTVNDFWSNREENLEAWAQTLRYKGKNRQVFDALYSSSKRRWLIREIALKTGLSAKMASEAAKALSDKGLLTPNQGNPLTYSKRPEVYRVKDKLLTLARNPKKLASLATKRRPSKNVIAQPAVAYFRGRAIHVTIDEIASFARVKRIDKEQVPERLDPPRLSEDTFKRGIENILGERARLKDWGGENLDLYSTNLVLGKKRVAAGIALKGPAKSGPLTPGKMGKNGDQIQRLMSQSIDIAIVQYEGDVAVSVPYQLEKLAREKARSEDKNIYFCLINLLDSYRLRLAYRKEFARAEGS